MARENETTSRTAAVRELDLRIACTYQRAIRARARAEGRSALADAAEARLAELETERAFDAHLPMSRLAARLGLVAEEVELAWTIVACSIDGRLVAHLEALAGAHARRGASVALHTILAELDEPIELAHTFACSALVDCGLITCSDAASPAARAYTASPRLIAYLRDDLFDIAPLAPVAPPATNDHHLYDDVQRTRLDELSAMFARGQQPVVVVEGPHGTGRATAVARASGAALVALDLGGIGVDELAGALQALRRECALRAAIPVLANVDHAPVDPHGLRAIGRFLDTTDGPVVVTAALPGLDLAARRPLVRIGWPVASAHVRAALWQRAVADAGLRVDGELHELAHRYAVGPAAICCAATTVQLLHPPGSAVDGAALAAGLRHNIAEQLGGLATRVEVTQSWDDLVVGDDIADQIAALVGRIRHAHHVLDTWGFRGKLARGAGVAALFSGPPGTGKTMVAGLIARELGLELYQVELSKVVSKWVGETEKNLGRIFDAAEAGHALLLFDEADALFGQRATEMKSANDRYANLEVNYLLQRIEAFGGITILTTNLDAAIDPALKRRLAAHVVFANPDEDERAELWRCNTTAAAPLAGDIDHGALARNFPSMSGAHIRNAAIAAAFLAATEGAPTITFEHLVRAARAEYRSMGHMVVDPICHRSTLR